ncbi:MAG TPA: S41 family peptidase [Clostridiaceae bacterium]|nr:S41 family peptidase [Clostridiaceae bacterium]
MNKNKNLIIGIIIIMVLTSVITFVISGVFFMGLNRLNPVYSVSFDPKDVSIESIRKFNQVRNILKEDYYQELDEDTLLEGAVAGMAYSTGDVYTVYYTKEQMQKLLEISNKSEETYVGIGVTVIMGNDGLLSIVDLFDDSPAKDAGMMSGDKIIKVDGEDVTGIKDSDLIIEKIKGPENTKVTVTVIRPSEGRTIDFEIIRKRVKYAINLRSEIIDGNIGYVKIVSFNDRNISSLFANELQKLIAKGIKGLVIDVRDNPGGYYDQVCKIADMLLPEGIIVYTEDRNNKKEIEESDAMELKMPITVLINGNSASASEVLAGALKDHKKATLIGTKTFGKGLVQSIKVLEDGSGIKYTTARYFTPSGVCIHGIGIEPDIEVPVPSKYEGMPVSQIPKGDDVQLQTAVEVLRGKLQ